MRRRSRLKTTQLKKSQQTVVLSIIGIVIVLFVLYKFGLEALINFSLFVTGHSGKQASNVSSSINFVSAPLLNPLPSATNSARIIISGNAKKGSNVSVYINNSIVDQINVDEKGNFRFEEDLSKGNNLVETKARVKNIESDFSNQYSVFYSNQPPKLDVNSPNDGQTYNKNDVGTDNSIQVSGQTDSGANVTINGFYAILDENNSFSYTLKLQNGENQINIVAKDAAGNTTEKNLKVSFSQ